MGVLENVMTRLPHIPEDEVRKAVEESGGHGGKAIAILQRTGLIQSEDDARNLKISRIKEKFSRFDRDGAGAIERHELFRVLRAVNIQGWTDKHIERLLEAMNVNSDGCIRRDEFVDFVFTGRELIKTRDDQAFLEDVRKNREKDEARAVDQKKRAEHRESLRALGTSLFEEV
eukprot:TRINITY_DN8938_c0_g2_i1.p1 TRINITY_DN8938_c0_g2~~TRINITY_DN8938_c0_g2_i1.p1  ORF type:complete len:173 (+),score=31.72 TRINITY_DN8938_c0_g2_i1:172-690(+)